MFDVVLGIDPGLSRCGYGAVRRDGPRLVPVAYGVLRTPSDAPVPERLAMLQADLDALLDDVAPAVVAVERVLFQVNARTAITVGQASGLALVGAARRGIPIAHYSPNEVKLAVTGDGAADKAQVQAMVTRLCHLDVPPRPADAADALALAVCHVWAAPIRAHATTARASSRLVGAIAAALARDGVHPGAPTRGSGDARSAR